MCVCTFGVLISSLVDRSSSYNDDMLTTGVQNWRKKRESTTASKSCDVMTLRCLRPPLSFSLVLLSRIVFLNRSLPSLLLVLFRGHQRARSGGGGGGGIHIICMYDWVSIYVQLYITWFCSLEEENCSVSCVSISALSTWLYFMIRLYVAESDCFLALR